MEKELVFATYLAPSIRPMYEFVARRVGEELGRPARLVTASSFDLIRRAEVDFAFVCGLPYVRLRREDPRSVEAIAAPVVEGARYQGRPIYFSDVIVPNLSPAFVFEDLRGGSWAYNEPDSHSGYLVTLFHLLGMGETGSFFGRSELTGFHHESIWKVARHEIDATAVDTQVLAVELRETPSLAGRIRIIATFGPSTIQPLVATRSVPDSLRGDVQALVTRLGRGGADRSGLAAGIVERFVAVGDSDYDDIRDMLAAVELAGLELGVLRGR
jgi:phosphonate transport system substrate-binding protein